MGGSLSDYKLLSSDCYGTPIDRGAGISAVLQPLLAGAKAFRQ